MEKKIRFRDKRPKIEEMLMTRERLVDRLGTAVLKYQGRDRYWIRCFFDPVFRSDRLSFCLLILASVIARGRYW